MKSKPSCKLKAAYETIFRQQEKLDQYKKDISDLLELQSNMRNLLFNRPFDIEKMESTAVKLCDAIIDLNDLD